MKAMKIFSIFINYLKDSFLETMNKFLDHIEVSESDIDFVLVVPALCGEGTKMFMREAAIKVRWRVHKIYSGCDLSSGISKPEQFGYVKILLYPVLKDDI